MNNDLEQFSEERLLKIIEFVDRIPEIPASVEFTGDEARALARIALAMKSLNLNTLNFIVEMYGKTYPAVLCQGSTGEWGWHFDGSELLVDFDEAKIISRIYPPSKPTFEEWLSTRTDTIESDCGCVSTETFYHWLKVAYEATTQPAHTGQDGWIKCSERMPRRGERVLIFIDFDSCTVPASIHDAEFTGETFRRGKATMGVFGGKDVIGVTHWMELPAAPKPESEPINIDKQCKNKKSNGEYNKIIENSLDRVANRLIKK